MTAFVLKLMAMVSILFDHVGYSFLDNNLLMRSIGRLAFVLYAFLIAESYYHLRNKPDRLKYHLIKLLILCVITEIPFNLYDYRSWTYIAAQNALFTLTLGFVALVASGWWTKRCKNNVLSVAGSVIICLLAATASYFLRSEYKFAGVLLIVFFYLYLRKADEMNHWQRIGVLVVLFAGYWFFYIWARAGFRGDPELPKMWTGLKRYLPGTFAAMIPIALYNRKLGYRSRWFQIFYSCFYPLQFIVLLIVRAGMGQ